MRRTAALLLGLSLLTYHYLRRPALWHDEASLVLNVLARDFAEAFGPLLYFGATPPLFLCLERLAFVLLGDSLYSLRLPSFLAAAAALVLFALVARRRLTPGAAAWVVLLFGCSDRFLWHGSEAKPYAVDLFLATAALALHTSAAGWPAPRRLLLWGLLSPPMMWLSYPAAFLVGGLLLSELPEVIRERRWSVRGGYVLWALAATVALVLLALGPVRAQRRPEIDSCWTLLFPDWSRPWLVPVWAVRSALGVLSYCGAPLGIALTIPFVLGVRAVWQRGERRLLALLLGPIFFAFLASLIGKYPFGGARVLFFAAPALLLFVGSGLEVIAAHLQARGTRLVFVAILLVPAANGLFRAAHPWPRAATDEAAADVLTHRQDSEAVVVNSWECLYYFRDLQNAMYAVDDIDPPSLSTPLWAVVVGTSDEQRDEVLAYLMRGRDVLERRDYRQAVVVRLSRPCTAAADSGQ